MQEWFRLVLQSLAGVEGVLSIAVAVGTSLLATWKAWQVRRDISVAEKAQARRTLPPEDERWEDFGTRPDGRRERSQGIDVLGGRAEPPVPPPPPAASRASRRTPPGKRLPDGFGAVIGILLAITLLAGALASSQSTKEWVVVSRPFALWLFYFCFMLLGMSGQYMFGLKSMKDFDWFEFMRPVAVALIVFAPFWALVNVSGVSYAAVAGAYQNGFFWKIVLDKEQKKLAE